MRTVLRRAPRGGPRLSLGLVCCLPWLPPCLSPRSSRPLVPHAPPCSRGACGRRGGGSAGSGGARSGPASWPPRPRERLKPHAIDIRVNIDPVHWFLSPPCDTRSSLYLEDAATVDGGRKRRRGDRVAAVQNGGAQPCSSLRGEDRGDSPDHTPFQREAQECTATWRSGARYDVRC